MNKGKVKATVLAIVFILSLYGFGELMNHTNEDLTTEMKGATLPILSLYADETEMNLLYGYTQEMDARYVRDTITPIGSSRLLPVTIHAGQTKVDAISYEIRSLDAGRLIANADVSSYEEQKGKITAELKIQNLLEAGEEYLLIIQLESAGAPIYYYTRIIEPIDSYVDECLDFVMDFHEKTFNDQTTGTLSAYMERTTGDNSTLQYVSLNSSLKQVGWADFGGERLTMPVPSIKEITDTYSVIVLDYVMTSIGENNESEYYNVEEYYRVRYTRDRFYVLNFERTMNQIFRGENDNVYENKILLGIREGKVEYKSNAAGNRIAFVQEGELWGYHAAEHTLAKIFSFRGYEGIDSRENYGEHDIKIASIDEAGNIDFVVYGYMNRGIHEGQVGIAVYRYDSISNTNEEMVFIPSDKSYEVMKEEFGHLMYVNDGGQLFLMLDGSVYGIDLHTMETEELVKGLTDASFAVSKSNRYFAWIKGDYEKGSDTIYVMDLSNRKMTEILAEGGKKLKPLGFMEEDLVYGIAGESDIFTDAAGNTILPMAQVKIADVSKAQIEELKTYEKPGYFVSDIEIEGYTMYLNRIQYNGTAYVEANQDMIMDREGDSGKPISIDTTYHEEKKTQIQITLANPVPSKRPKLLTPKETILEEERIVALQDGNETERYYVYVKGDVISATDNVTEAVTKANERMGVVIGNDLRYVWKRSRKAYVTPFRDITSSTEDGKLGSIAGCMNAMLEREGINISVEAMLERGEAPREILKNTMKDRRVFDFSGCGVEEILYYVSCGSPVFAMSEGQKAVLIIGYDANTVTIFDAELGASYKRSISEADQMFADAGGVFLSYLNE
ncbi:MAG: hypothetical protein ACI4DR_09780 [Roseburia sp.]